VTGCYAILVEFVS